MDDRAQFDEALTAALAAIGVAVDAPRRERMWHHFERVVEANRQFNLTRITSPADAAVKHYADSLALLAAPWAPDLAFDVLDVGTGAGFPAVPLAVAQEAWQVVAIDGTGKKARFVAETAATLGLANLEARHARAADLARQRVAPFDLVLLRAVTQLAPGLEEVRDLVRPGGAVVFYKSGSVTTEEQQAGDAAARRWGFAGDVFRLQLPAPEGPIERQLIRYLKR